MNNSTAVYDQNLPIFEARQKLISLISAHQVIIVAGQTGSGKTTQLPLLCLEAQRGTRGKIACTQPRRIAAMSVASYVASKLNTQLGNFVGYKVRFSEKATPQTVIKFMTDGILLTEIERDKLLRQYDTIIIDEAHERSLNIDFLLGYLRFLLPRRPDLKVIISSATIDTTLFSKSFNDAPVQQVSGRLYPIELLYKNEMISEESLDDSDNYVDQALVAVKDLFGTCGWGDMLVFMPTERDIRETCERLGGDNYYRDVDIIPLFSRLSKNEQLKIFTPSRRTKIVVCTNIAETSITVPGIRYVVDTGLARISRYAPRLRTNRLPIEPISKASADQRKGRCGRVQEGVCIRLYTEKEYLSRDEFTQPEIMRSNLAGVILSMKAHNLGCPEEFPFIQPPSKQAISDAYAMLYELGALDNRKELTPSGKEMARLPFDPHISRMILAARDENALKEVTIIAAALSIIDPRERPLDRQEQADQMHAKFIDKSSDFMTFVNLWSAYQSEWKALKSQNRMRKFCKEHFLSYLRMREWNDVYQQLHDTLCKMKGFKENTSAASYDSIHRSLLSGLLSNCAFLDNRGKYRGAKGKELLIFPGSALAKKKNQWIMCHEVVETSQVFARTVASIKPSWLEELAVPLCKKSYDNPFFDSGSGTVRAKERVSLFGMLINSNRLVRYGKVNKDEASDIFINQGLIEENLRCYHKFYKHNRKVKSDILSKEDRIRSRTLYAGDTMLYRFYKARIPEVSSIHDLNRVIKKRKGDGFLYINKKDLLAAPMPQKVHSYPDKITIGGSAFPISYNFEPGSDNDGFTVTFPSCALSYIPENTLDWIVPALLPEKVKDLIGNLPRELRKKFIPLNETSQTIASALSPSSQPFARVLSDTIKTLYNIDIAPSFFDEKRAAPHLVAKVKVVDPKGKEIISGRGAEVITRCSDIDTRANASPLQKRFDSFRKVGIREWPDENLSEPIEIGSGDDGIPLKGYAALKADKDDSVEYILCKTEKESDQIHRSGVQKLLEIAAAKDLSWLEKDLSFSRNLKLLCTPFGGPDLIKSQLYELICDYALSFTKLPRTKQGFEQLLSDTHNKLKGTGYRSVTLLEDFITQLNENYKKIGNAGKTIPKDIRGELCDDLKTFTDDLIDLKIDYNVFVNYPRYMRAFSYRIERAMNDPLKYRNSRSLLAQYQNLAKKYSNVVKEKQSGTVEAFKEYLFMVNEFSISLFAQHIRTAMPVSEKRLKKKLQEIGIQ
ncbi:ATP-dependent RNA helicase HrpA [Chitinispirillales bacterium ANBcel5]|uniref:ATP-dependent RNA helicase HrpA n=1 Tax=Cellulosispirillum alkaliphilum TaxID=3039283 RepID=UPI002A58F175|nr:ATP-dependent RNA helicase HrpA [Chitinispirillales bacterium ANBcel5]